jgi:hypothetical protein
MKSLRCEGQIKVALYEVSLNKDPPRTATVALCVVLYFTFPKNKDLRHNETPIY